jgi:hypothetical protein
MQQEEGAASGDAVEASDGSNYTDQSSDEEAGSSATAPRHRRRQRGRQAAAGSWAGAGSASSTGAQPSNLLKVLRPPPAPRPLFLAAPGVANAQSAYFSFSSFLQWADQPIYVLDKDNDLDIARCGQAARRRGSQGGRGSD